MQLATYLGFPGQCEEAFKFYEGCFAAKLGPMFRYAGTEFASQVPPDWQDKVMHASVSFGETVIMACDDPPSRYHAPAGVSLSLQLSNVADAERIFGELSEGGNVTQPLETTFWAARFGAVTDRFGIPWIVNCDGSEA